MAPDAGALQRAARWLREAREVVVFSGAGASAESGIPTFRDDDGLWRTFPPDEFANWRGLLRLAASHPARVADFVHAVLQPMAAAEPNPGHRAIAAIGQFTRVTVATQNIDGLHQDAGSERVLEVHGSLLEIVAPNGRPLRRLSRAELLAIVEKLDRARHSRLALLRMLAAVRRMAGIGFSGMYRPNVVLFGDAMAEPAWSLAIEACRRCDLLIQVGCSGAVWPAAMLPEMAKSCGAPVIAVDPNESPADLWLPGAAGQVLPALVEAASGGTKKD
jgi:NAD-dependent deacetylase